MFSVPDFLQPLVSSSMQFTTDLPFSEEDKRVMPWLALKKRAYRVVGELGKGGRAIALKGEVDGFLDSEGRPVETVIKLPNLDVHRYPVEDIRPYLLQLQDEVSREWRLTRERLRDCPYANSIFDLHVFQVSHLDELLSIPATVQRYLTDAVPLDEFLLNTRQRAEKYKSKRGVPVDNWRGMTDPEKWLTLASAIAVGLADIHDRRVVHGDIWPPNVFIRQLSDGTIAPVFIDFGEAFPFEPKGEARDQRDHAYRAPERKNASSIVTNRADVYSFGKLLLHLATGEEPILPSSAQGHVRRENIKNRFRSRNEGLAADNPFIIDIICSCVELDPVDRPSMNEVVRALKTYVDIEHYPPKRTPSTMVEVLESSFRELKELVAVHQNSIHPFFEDLVAQRLHDIKRMITRSVSGVVNLRDTREHLILDMIGVFLRLAEGDRFISITSPRMWQGSALGLNGRYLTATQLAASRGASIQRAFVVSIEELGANWVMALIRELNKVEQAGAKEDARRLSTMLELLLDATPSASRIPDSLIEESRNRFRLVVKSYADAKREVCDRHFSETPYESFGSERGLFVGLCFVRTVAEVDRIKAAHPMSVFRFEKRSDHNRHLLMVTDCVARSPIGFNGDSAETDDIYALRKPTLRGVMFFRSVLGVPEGRIQKLERLFKRSVNIGYWAATFQGCMERASEAVKVQREGKKPDQKK